MKWLKKGKIFDPGDHTLPFASIGYAQGPSALVLSDRVRIFFSTREQDHTGKYLSHIAFADFDRDLTQVLEVCKAPVLPLGGLGCFDEHGIFPIHVFDDGARLLAYTTGWNRKVSVSADAAIGLAISHDAGLTFERHGPGPVMAANLKEPFLIGDASVLKHGDRYHMWYIFGVRWIRRSDSNAPDRVYKIAHATSSDGISWRRDGLPIICDKLDVDECQALPSVIQIDGVFHMYFCYRSAYGFREEADKSYRIGYAWSPDLETWTRADEEAGIAVSPAGWDSKMLCYPHIFRCGERIVMLYNGNEFGRNGFGLAELQR